MLLRTFKSLSRKWGSFTANCGNATTLNKNKWLMANVHINNKFQLRQQ